MATPDSDRLSIFVASQFLEAVKDEWAEVFDLAYAAQADPLEELAERAVEGTHFDVVLLSLDIAMRAPEIAALPDSVKALATYSVGTDHIDCEAAKARGIAVFNTPGVLADSVAENAILLMLGAARRATESIRLLRNREWQGWTPVQLVGVQLSGRTLGILGMGDIGERVATRAKAFGMRILYHNRTPRSDLPSGLAEYRDSAQKLGAESDVLVLACPSTEATRGIIDREFLASVRPAAILVNIARGDLVDDDALIEALEEGQIGAAGLDVFAGEPDIDERYFGLPGVFMLPHIGSSTIEARLGMGRILTEALLAWQSGHLPANRVV